MTSNALCLRHLLLALAVVVVWGTNFVVIRVALDVLPPLLLATLRFIFVLLPAVFFLPRPKAKWGNLAIYGVAVGLIQFGLLFIAMNGSIPPGLASLVVQMQVFFTVALSMQRQGERLATPQFAAFLLALAGMGVIAAHSGHGTTLAGLALTLLAALGWAISNQAAKEAGRAAPGLNMLAYVVWASLFAVPPLLALSLLREGWPAIAQALGRAGPVTWAAVLWQSAGNTMFGYAVWGWLLARYPAATIAPLSLLVPLFGMGSAALLLGEPLQGWKIGASALVMGGLALNFLWLRRAKAHPAANGASRAS